MELYPAIGVYGYPKCGNTWVQGIFAALGQQEDPKYHQDDIYITRRKKNRFRVHPVVTLDGHPCIVFKSHAGYSGGDDPIPDMKELGISGLKKVILVKRNPFDLLLSVLNFAGWGIQEAAAQGKKRKDMEEVIRGMAGLNDEQFKVFSERPDVLDYLREIGACDRALRAFVDLGYAVSAFSTFSGSWLSQINSWESQDQFEVLSVRYEDLFFKSAEQLARISEFTGTPVERLETAFNKRQNATSRAHDREVASQRAAFYNKCSAGYFREYFSQSVIESVFELEKETFRKVGYGDILDIC